MRRHGWRAVAALSVSFAITISFWAMRWSANGGIARDTVRTFASGRFPTEISAKREAASRAKIANRPVQEPMSYQARTLASALGRDDLCAVAKLILPRAFARENVEAMLSQTGLDSELAELTRRTSPLFADSLTEFHGIAARFYQAILRAGLLDGPIPPNPLDLKSARTLLLALEEEDGENAAYPFFRLAVESRLDFPEDELLETMRAISTKSSFDTYMAGLQKLVFVLSRTNASYWLLGRGILSTLPVPNYMPSNLLLKGFARKYGRSEEARAIAALLMKQGQETDLTAWEYGYSPLEYQVGRHLHTEAVDRAAESFPTYIELDRAREIERFGHTYDFHDSFESSIDTKNCKREPFYDDAFREFVRFTESR